MIVSWRDIRVRVRIAAEKPEDVESAFEEIRSDVARVAKKANLTKRHNLAAHDTYATVVEPMSNAEMGDPL